ncbi:enoyl-CoA hydratase/isomerase family protein [Catenuloplanes atrovinosus]|uniref:Enoyl-CoA hydratase/carnithine racemase n=1 Tax=Catenuloplanes atrovinosus TaxID=137266 RepID=A0AAE4CAP5_9ACTN|nr:enoyl-CoA hydratase/isomerase family protein [Catenuloplanes atrovinosus]MDR7277242.1 enoyl-CoA hydratase/carnithine racemase [Catenuloplanes atrovinosus]
MYDYKALQVTVADGVAQVTIDHPPVNLLDTTLIGDLGHFIGTVRDDSSVRVIVFQSANPDFFLAHVDFEFMEHPERFAALAGLVPGDGTLNPMQSLHLALRSLPQLTIAKLRGRLRGGGNEFAMATDLRFAAAGQTWLSQVESRIGIIPGGGGTQLLPRLTGRARALEVILTGDLYDARTAELYGWINRAVPPEELDATVDAVARTIAARRPEQITAAKQAVDGALLPDDLAAALGREGAALAAVYPAPEEIVAKVARAVQAGAQSPDGELDLENAIARA